MCGRGLKPFCCVSYTLECMGYKKKKQMASNLEAGRGGAHGIMGWKAQVLEERAKKGDGMWGEYR